MARKRQIVLMKKRDGGPSAEMTPLGSGDDVLRCLAPYNTAPDGAPAASLGTVTLYGPGMMTLDFAVARSFAITETNRLQLRMEAFNGLNRVNLGTPNRFVNTAQFGTITEPASPGRQIQVSARYSF